jgi:hypothetical protein
MLRFVFAETRVIDVRVFHERGPRYVSPEDVVNFVEKQVNDASGRKLLRKI